MVHPRPQSFRRILLLQILLLSIPILLLGQYVTLRKARTSLLETARQNLTSSAIRKAADISRSIQSLQSSLQIVTQTNALQTGSLAEIRQAIHQYASQMPQDIDCIQLSDGRTHAITLNTCNAPLLSTPSNLPWLTGESPVRGNSFSLIDTGVLDASGSSTPLSPDTEAQTIIPKASSEDSYTWLEVIIAAPVYAADGTLRYTLSLRARLPQLENTSARSLVGDTVIIDDNGLILTHPDPTQIGQSIDTLGDADRLNSIVGNVKAGNSATLHLFRFMPDGTEWLAGYTGVQVPQSPTEQQLWTVLAVTPLEHALQGLKDIRQGLILLTLGLLTANGLLALFIARGLSLPIERLSDSAQKVQDLAHLKTVPEDFRIWELKHLARVLNRMIKRLDEGAQELKRAWQDAQLANQLKSEFLANTSHELRTPLNAIIGCIRLVRDDCCDSREEELEFLDRADAAAIHLLRIINDILDIAKIESGTLSLKPELIDLRQILREVVDLQSLQIQQKSLQFIYPEIPTAIWILADRAKLKQVLLNIIYNAVKFTEEGGVEVQLQTQTADHTDSDNDLNARYVIDPLVPLPRVVVAVRDTGIGVDPQQQHKLFQPFVMVDGSTTRRFEGTGLGLAISKNLVDLMGGSIHLYSQGVGQGTTVLLVLPLANPPDTEDASGDNNGAIVDRLPSPSGSMTSAER
ncbi:sensor histidine kinase [Halomicronema hongdechloris]|nr:sensor histidine kinase [Halomicronema hongdechloris]